MDAAVSNAHAAQSQAEGHKSLSANPAYVADQDSGQVANFGAAHIVHSDGPAVVGVLWLPDKAHHLRRTGGGQLSRGSADGRNGGRKWG